MKYYETDCHDCGLPCLFESCPYYKVTHYQCDFCKIEDVKLYRYNGWEICEECLLKEYEIIEGTEEY